MDLLVKYQSDEIREHMSVKYAKRGDAGIDLYNASGKEIIIKPDTKERGSWRTVFLRKIIA